MFFTYLLLISHLFRVIAQYATASAGMVLVCINPAYKAEELQYVLEKVNSLKKGFNVQMADLRVHCF